MYQVVNKDTIYVGGNFGAVPWRRRYEIREIGDEDDLIRFLAQSFRRQTDDWWNYEWYSNPAFDYEYFDGYGRNIEVKCLYDRAWQLYVEKYKHEVRRPRRYIKTYKGEFRRDPVPHTHKYRKLYAGHGPNIKRLLAIYNNPEYKDFNRGSAKEIKELAWEDWYRDTDRCWKSYRKHQWKEK